MPLFKKESEQEKEAERQRQAAEDARRAAEQAEGQRLAAEREAEERAFAETLPKVEYKVLTLSSEIWSGGGKFQEGGLQQTLNTYAAQGWRVIDIAVSGKIEQSFSADRNDMYVILERPARPPQPDTVAAG